MWISFKLNLDVLPLNDFISEKFGQSEIYLYCYLGLYTLPEYEHEFIFQYLNSFQEIYTGLTARGCPELTARIYPE